MRTSICGRCGLSFEHKRVGAKFCPSCHVTINREKQVERNAAVRVAQSEVLAVAESLRPYLMPEHYAKIEDYLAELGVPMPEAGISHDRMPDGTMSNGGSDDGMSTTDIDLADVLDVRRLEVIAHDWFIEHPNWQEGLYG